MQRCTRTIHSRARIPQGSIHCKHPAGPITTEGNGFSFSRCEGKRARPTLEERNSTRSDLAVFSLDRSIAPIGDAPIIERYFRYNLDVAVRVNRNVESSLVPLLPYVILDFRAASGRLTSTTSSISRPIMPGPPLILANHPVACPARYTLIAETISSRDRQGCWDTRGPCAMRASASAVCAFQNTQKGARPSCWSRVSVRVLEGTQAPPSIGGCGPPAVQAAARYTVSRRWRAPGRTRGSPFVGERSSPKICEDPRFDTHSGSRHQRVEGHGRTSGTTCRTDHSIASTV